jgi:hypothetical protein
METLEIIRIILILIIAGAIGSLAWLFASSAK